MVNYINTTEDFQQALELSKTKLVVVDFTATWCGPCKMVTPVFEQMAKDNPEAEFLKCDVDEAQDVAAQCEVSAMPTFHFYKGGAKVAEVVGANIPQLQALVVQHK